MVSCSTGARRLEEQARDQNNQQRVGDIAHIFVDEKRCVYSPVAPSMRLTPNAWAALNMPLSPMARCYQNWQASGPRYPQINLTASIH
jgi:hypothetical protein